MKRIRLIASSAVVWAGFLSQSEAGIDLGSADSFAVLGGAYVTSTGATVINGNVGVYPGTAVNGFPPGSVNGATYNGGPVAMQAQMDAATAYNSIASQTPTANLTGQDLGGLVLTSGVYSFSSSAQLTGTLTLTGTGYFVFLIGSTLTTASASSIMLEDGALAANVFWQVGSSATLGTSTMFDGSILANTDITMNTGASLTGRALALNGFVSLTDNNITVPEAPVPEPGTLITGGLLLLPFGSSALRRILRRQQTASM